jgi:hypothetical protein
MMEVLMFFTNLKFVIAFAVNQVASFINMFLVGTCANLSLAIAVTNCVAFIATFVAEKVIKKQRLIDLRFYLGVLLIVFGIFI